jgi:hypothetical protein
VKKNNSSPAAAISSAVAVLLVAGFANQAYAAQINASLIPEFDRAAGSFIGVKFVQMRYERGSSVADLFNGKTERIEFSITGTNSSGIDKLIAAANRALLKVNSPVQITSANLTYSGVVRGEVDKLTLTYNVEFVPTFSGFKIDKNAADNIPMDINWRGFVIDGPVLVDSPEHGMVNVNQPIGLLTLVSPEFAERLVSSSEVRQIMEEPILDFSEIGAMPMERWHWLFDPTWSQASTGSILRGEGIGSAKVMSVYSLGECSIREGCPPPKEGDATVSIDGTPLQVHISTPQPNSQIEIAGFTSIEKAGGQEMIRVKMDNPSLSIPPFTMQVLLVLGGMMGAIAFFVLFKSRK